LEDRDEAVVVSPARGRAYHASLPTAPTEVDLWRSAIDLQGPDRDSCAVIEAIRRFAVNETAP
jgi:hypothetical protein